MIQKTYGDFINNFIRQATLFKCGFINVFSGLIISPYFHMDYNYVNLKYDVKWKESLKKIIYKRFSELLNENNGINNYMDCLSSLQKEIPVSPSNWQTFSSI